MGRIFCYLLLLSLAVNTAVADEVFPSKPVRLIVGVPAGTGADTDARIFATQLSEELGQQVYVDNRPGDSTFTAMKEVSAAKADGYTLGFATSAFTSSPRLYNKPPFDVDKGFSYISLLSEHRWVLVVGPSSSAKSVSEFVALAKAKPSAITYGTVGAGSIQHLAGELFQQITDTKLRHIPYGRSNPIVDLVGGHIDASFPALVGVIGQTKNTVRILAVTGESRASMLPDVPTFAEAGFPKFEGYSFTGLIGPADLHASIVAKLNAAAIGAVKSKRYQEFNVGLSGAIAVGSSAEKFESYVRSERIRMKALLDSAGVQME